jgi:hypothetical protein
MSCKPLKSLREGVMNLSEKFCPWYFKAGGLLGVASISYYIGRWLGARSKLQKIRDEKTNDDGEIEVVL